MRQYEVALLGGWPPTMRRNLERVISLAVAEFQLNLNVEFVLHDENTVASRDLKLGFAAAYFCQGETEDHVLSMLIAQQAVIIPVVGSTGSLTHDVPLQLSSANGMQITNETSDLELLSFSILECIGLLRKQRRVFLSYRRAESSEVAIQLHDFLRSRGFSVFLDTHDIRPGEQFQDSLWHSMTDSDVVIMLETETYFQRKWTRAEFAKALAKGIQLYRLVWPGLKANRGTEIAETKRLLERDFETAGRLRGEALSTIAQRLEWVRSRSIAARHRSLVDRLGVEVSGAGGFMSAIGAHRAIGIELRSGKRVWAYPIVGVPTAETLNDISSKSGSGSGEPILIYDHVGIHPKWMEHLSWLNREISCVKALKIEGAAWALSTWGEVA